MCKERGCLDIKSWISNPDHGLQGFTSGRCLLLLQTYNHRLKCAWITSLCITMSNCCILQTMAEITEPAPKSKRGIRSKRQARMAFQQHSSALLCWLDSFLKPLWSWVYLHRLLFHKAQHKQINATGHSSHKPSSQVWILAFYLLDTMTFVNSTS